MPAQDPSKQLARELASLRREVSSLSRGSGMRYRSIDGGGIPVYDDSGSHRGTIGMLPDGTTGFTTVGGPRPPEPSAASLEPEVGGLRVTYDGTFWEGAAAPGDLKRIEVHASPYAVYEPSEATHRADLIAAGELFLILPPDAYTVVLVAVSTSGQRSDPSVPATETPLRAPTYTEVVAANGKNKVFWRSDATAPTKAADALIDGDLWFQKDHGYKPTRWDDTLGQWVDARLGDDAVAGLNVGKLTAGEISAGEAVYFGPRFGTHAEGSSTGFRVFRQDPDTGLLDEVIRLGTDTNDYFAVVDSDGALAATVDDTGTASFQGLNVLGDPVFGGYPLSQMLDEKGGGVVGWFADEYGSTDYGPIHNAVGVSEVTAPLRADHLYEVTIRMPWYSTVANDEMHAFLYATNGPDGTDDMPAAPQVTAAISTRLTNWYFTSPPTGGRYITASGTFTFQPTVNAIHRLLLGAERGQGTGDLYIVGASQTMLAIKDLGPATPPTGQFTQAGGAFYNGTVPAPAPSPKKQYDTGAMAPAGWLTYSGSGARRTDTSDVVQGWDPSGFNGDGKGHWWWTLPSITGTVDRVDVYLYSNHWYYNSGGTALLSPTTVGNGGPNYTQPRGVLAVPGYPKPGGKWITLPKDWYPLFKNGGAYGFGRSDGIRVGPGGGTNLTYYGRFTGSAARLRIWYTQ